MKHIFIVYLLLITNFIASMERPPLSALEQRFSTAALHGNLEEVRECVAQKVNVNSVDEYGVLPLSRTIAYQHFDVADFLLDQNTLDINHTNLPGSQPLLECIICGYCRLPSQYKKTQSLSLFKKAIAKGADVSQLYMGESILHCAILSNVPVDFAQCLVDAGACLQYYSPSSKGTLSSAAFDRSSAKVLLLLSIANISLADIQTVLKELGVKYYWQRCSDGFDFDISDESAQARKRGRLLKSYYETMRALGYVHPHEKEWQTSRHIPLPLPIGKKIAYFVSLVVPHSTDIQNSDLL